MEKNRDGEIKRLSDELDFLGLSGLENKNANQLSGEQKTAGCNRPGSY